MASPTQQHPLRLLYNSIQEEIRNKKLRKAMDELKELQLRLDLGVKNLEASWEPIDMAIFEKVVVEEAVRSNGTNMEAMREDDKLDLSMGWTTIDEWVVQVRNATSIGL